MSLLEWQHIKVRQGKKGHYLHFFLRGSWLKKIWPDFPKNCTGILWLRQRKNLDLTSTLSYQAWVCALNKSVFCVIHPYQPFCNNEENDLLCPDTGLLPGKLYLTSAGSKRNNRASCSSIKFAPWIFASTCYNIINVIRSWTCSFPYPSAADCNRTFKNTYLFLLLLFFFNVEAVQHKSSRISKIGKKNNLLAVHMSLMGLIPFLPTLPYCCTSWIPEKLRPSIYKKILGRWLGSSVHWLEREDWWSHCKFDILGPMYHNHIKTGWDTRWSKQICPIPLLDGSQIKMIAEK